MAAGGTDENIKVYDRRDNKIVRTFTGLHSGKEGFLLFALIAKSASPVYSIGDKASGFILFFFWPFL